MSKGSVKRVVVIGTGGTIASRWQGTGYAAEAAGDEVLAGSAVPEGVEVSVRDLFTVNSSQLTTAHQLELLRTVHEVLADPSVDGVVVTHGTDTMEESAFLLDLHHHDRRPVVFTGAQLPLDSVDGDAAGNLYDAMLTAATGRDIGVVIAFGGFVHAARGTLKVHTLDPRGAFADPSGRPLGRVKFGEIAWGQPRGRAEVLPVPETAVRTPRVDVVMHHVDADPVLFEAALGAGAQGIVLVGTGAGNATPEFVAAVERAVAAGVLVAVSTRVAAGPVAPMYTGGGAVDLAEAGAVLTGELRAGQARIAVLAALLTARSPQERADALRRIVEAPEASDVPEAPAETAAAA
ncbi:asparaginase [Streptomyces sp. NBC_01537]|uniref:asparaginase n=1 Tax=Streptomyces sp. NBC_01537 TaxID=2903896 RepID=UPI00386CC0FC